MDILSTKSLQILQSFSDNSAITNEVFQSLLEFSFSSIITNPCEEAPEVLEKIDAVTARSAHGALVTLIIEGAKLDIQDDQLVMILDECSFSSAMKEAFVTQFNMHRLDVRNHLSTIGIHHPHVVDLDWRLDYNIKNNHLHKVNKLRYTISLKARNGKDINFTCSREELQDFSSKLKEAVKAVERAMQE